ncbi:hypothetical protein ANN_28033 [Periplaneta americana]|uniref:Uncharacterized protein n=1 Tax=Periplaneta americana TaxID=6978 RepID=A0ABQ8RUS4_PERAM|nr:hypothetical protein ANN_28033 [Periplaneta americana]
MESESKERQKHGRVSDAPKKMRNQTHETGKNCVCSRLKCFEKISKSERQTNIKHFNGLSNRDSQNSHLSGLMKVNFIKLRRSRKDQDESDLSNHSYTYNVPIKRVQEESICYKGFIALHSITP